MRMNQDERRFDFHGLGAALKRAREEKVERLRTAVGDTFKPGDEQHLREDTKQR